MGGWVKRARCEVGGGRTCCRNVEKFLCLLGLRIRSFLTHVFVSLGPGKKKLHCRSFLLSKSLFFHKTMLANPVSATTRERARAAARHSGFFTFKMSPQRNGTRLRASWKENKYMTRVWVVGGGGNGGFRLSMIVF
jgi:hypothetical protein